MSSEVKSDAITGPDGKELELGHFDEAATRGEKENVAQRDRDGFFRPQEWPFSNTLKPTEYRYSSERCSMLILGCYSFGSVFI